MNFRMLGWWTMALLSLVLVGCSPCPIEKVVTRYKTVERSRPEMVVKHCERMATSHNRYGRFDGRQFLSCVEAYGMLQKLPERDTATSATPPADTLK